MTRQTRTARASAGARFGKRAASWLLLKDVINADGDLAHRRAAVAAYIRRGGNVDGPQWRAVLADLLEPPPNKKSAKPTAKKGPGRPKHERSASLREALIERGIQEAFDGPLEQRRQPFSKRSGWHAWIRRDREGAVRKAEALGLYPENKKQNEKIRERLSHLPAHELARELVVEQFKSTFAAATDRTLTPAVLEKILTKIRKELAPSDSDRNSK